MNSVSRLLSNVFALRMLFICEASLQNPQNVANLYPYIIGDSYRDYIDHSFHMKSSYIIELFVKQSDVKLVDYYSLLRRIKLKTKFTTISFCAIY